MLEAASIVVETEESIYIFIFFAFYHFYFKRFYSRNRISILLLLASCQELYLFSLFTTR